MNQTHENSRRQNERGTTIVEVAVGIMVTIAMLGMWVATSEASAATSGSVQRVSRMSQKLHRVLDRIAGELVQSSPEELTPAPVEGVGSSSLTFRRVDGFVSDQVSWGPTRTLEFRQDPADPQDGIDNDEDGLTDEGAVVLVTNPGLPNENVEVWLRGVASLQAGETYNGSDDNGNGLVDERGLSFELVGRTLTVRLTMDRVDRHGNVRQQVAETSIGLWN